MGVDPVVGRLRAEISELDGAVLAAVNARLELVAELKRHKESRGIDFVDPDRETQMLADLVAANGGPLSAEGVQELLAALLDLTKRELTREP
jgi:3-deoxy-7-phosphoheptulonate synthase/chorismate mutase